MPDETENTTPETEERDAKPTITIAEKEAAAAAAGDAKPTITIAEKEPDE
jgi:hypothetical protein